MSVTLSSASQVELNTALQRLADVAGTTIKEVLPAQMRLLADDLAFNTRPIGRNTESKEAGLAAVGKAIGAIYIPIGSAVKKLNDRKQGLGSAFVAAIKSGKFAHAGELMTKYFSGGSATYTLGRFDGGKLHRSQKFSKKFSRRMVVVNYEAVDTYIKKQQKLVGFAKGGFASAARQLGGTRGIPGYATRHKSAPGSASVVGDGKTLTVTMTNSVKYIRHALDKRGEQKAMDTRKSKVAILIKRIMKNKMKAASRSLK